MPNVIIVNETRKEFTNLFAISSLGGSSDVYLLKLLSYDFSKDITNLVNFDNKYVVL